jgi:hypothetical protein
MKTNQCCQDERKWNVCPVVGIENGAAAVENGVMALQPTRASTMLFLLLLLFNII